ncbi:pleiotropic drug resistance ABC transporter [Pholiota molesta]|nr:pleiotropic drug resistance ABC transporter [Pholiota molesta]
MPSQPTLFGAETLEEEKDHGEHPPTTHPDFSRGRRNSSVSRVDVDFFDPAGVQDIRRTMSKQLEDSDEQAKGRPSSISTDETIRVREDEPFDLEKMLRRAVRKREEHHIKSRSLGIGFKDLRVVGVTAANSYYPTVGDLFNPKAILQNIQSARHPSLRNILDGFEGVVKPGEMLLVLGSPGSGCSTLLKTLANQRQEYYGVHGEVHYDSLTPEELSKHFRGDTLSFAAAARTPRARGGQSRKQFTNKFTTILATIFGLRHALTTPVGNNAIRGVSGGEKKRVSIAEGLAARGCVGAWDNSTRGLDASTALEFVRALRIATDNFEQTTIVSIYQAGESLYEHFDKVCVIYEGRMVYFGLASQAKKYFMDMGYEPANRQTTATSWSPSRTRTGASRARASPRSRAPPPSSRRTSRLGRGQGEQGGARGVPRPVRRQAGSEERVHRERARGVCETQPEDEPLFVEYPQQAKIVMRRRVQIYWNKLNTFLVLFSYVFQALIIGSVFLNSPEATSAYFSRGGVLFFAVYDGRNPRPLLPTAHRTRHEKAAFYHPFVEALALTLVDVPITFVTTFVFAIILYFMPLRKVRWYLYSGAVYLHRILYSQAYYDWRAPLAHLYNPLKYGFESVMTNEFRTSTEYVRRLSRWPWLRERHTHEPSVYDGGRPPWRVDRERGSLRGLSYGFKWSNTWMNLGINIAFGVLSFGPPHLHRYSTTASVDTPITLFRRGANQSLPRLLPRTKRAATVPRMTDIFRGGTSATSCPSREGGRKLLDDVSGYVAPGKLTALMGESGAGKTTLLNVLAADGCGVVTGDRLVNGSRCRRFPVAIRILPADGYPCSFATVREALLFSAKLRQPPSVPLAEKEAYVEKCLEMCGLVAYADASSAWAIISFLRQLADNGQAILCTIHQPSAELFQVFDRILLLRKGGQTVYFGDLGQNATKLISYFETNGARECLPHENPAEYMLDVIGAGATATSAQNWYDIWQTAPESKELQQELDVIHTEGINRPAVTAELHSEFATSWLYQMWELLKRDAEAHWRDPSYVMAKLILNADTQQGTQNKLFAIFMATILSVPLSNQLQVPFINMRSIYEIRERPSRMYSWSALVASQILIELPWNVLGSFILFISWYWTVGFENSRAGYTFLMIVIAFPFYYTTFGQAVAAMSPSAEIAAVLFSFLFSFVITFNGVLQPYRVLGWWRWMYHLSPYTYLVEGLLGQAIGNQQINCSPVEFVSINPPSGMTCEQYMTPYMSFAGGYLENPSASTACQFCSVRTTDQFLEGAFSIYYSHHWRNFGFLMAFVVFNVFLVFLMTYIFRIHKGSFLPSFKKKKN